jgi:putative nucleotidyltransferase with HDIG domain
MQATRDVLFQAVYATMLPDVPGFRERMAAIFRHGVLVSRLARQLAPRMALDADVAFLAGLMHDVGRARCLKVVSKWLRGGVSSGLPSEALDRAVDILHAPAGADLVRAWHLGADVAVACEFHHAPAGRPLAALVALADLLAHGAENRDDDSGVMRIDAADTDAGCDPLARALDACQLPQSARDELVAIAAEEARFVTE